MGSEMCIRDRLYIDEEECIALLEEAADRVRELAGNMNERFTGACSGGAEFVSNISGFTTSCFSQAGLPGKIAKPLTSAEKMRDLERHMVVINHQMHLERSWTTASQDMLSYLATSKPFPCGLESRLLPQAEGFAQSHEHLFSLTTKGGMAWRSYDGAPWEYLYVLQVDRDKVLPTRRRVRLMITRDRVRDRVCPKGKAWGSRVAVTERTRVASCVLLEHDAIPPTALKPYGYDPDKRKVPMFSLHTREQIVLPAHGTRTVSTGIALEIKPGYYAVVTQNPRVTRPWTVGTVFVDADTVGAVSYTHLTLPTKRIV